MNKFSIRFYVWTYHSVKREVESWHSGNQNLKNPTIEISARDFDEAYVTAKNVITGILMDGRVWQAGIEKVEAVK
ncbi:MAG: hypothetical protein QM647_13095 [Asticcacaulis sp.]|uniref:hypothetical protein n=1 Tax=Asticcacaulis sp. TaxID=1872648 RepID=UPI0039E69218